MIAKIEIHILDLVYRYYYRKYRKCMKEHLKCLNCRRYIGAEQWTREANRYLEICCGIMSKRMEMAL